MFRKLVGNLPYSPALIADVGFYAKRLKKEEATRRSALIITALAIMVQSFAVFSPPESANASSEQDIIRGGVSSLEDFLLRYDHNEEDVKDIYNAAGVTRDEIEAAEQGVVKVKPGIYVLSRYGQLSASQKELSMNYDKSSGGTGVRYFSPLSSIADTNTHFQAWIGHSATLGWFAILKSNGSLATDGVPDSLDPVNLATASLTKSISIKNGSQNINGNIFTAKPNDKIIYTLSQSNKSQEVVRTTFSLRLADALEYSTLVSSGGGAFDEKTQTLKWPAFDLAPSESETRSFILQMLPDTPLTGVGASNPTSYDCKLSVVFGNNVQTPVECPPFKGIEGVFGQLPVVGIGLNIGFVVVLLAIILFFYLRTRQLRSEIRIVRHNFNTSAM